MVNSLELTGRGLWLRTGLMALLVFSTSGATARPLSDDEKRLIGQTVANVLQQQSVQFEWAPFVEDFSRNPIEKRIYCSTLETNGIKRPFMVKIVEEIDYHIKAIQPEHVYVVKPKGFTEKLNNTVTLQYCQEAGYAVTEP